MAEKRHVFDRDDVSQESQYAFPYHYIPTFEDGRFAQHLYWSWGYRYLVGVEVVLSRLGREPFESLVDVGCGDGRFQREVSRRFPGKRLLGIDCSKRAIDLARAMNPHLQCLCADICSRKESTESFDVVTLIEVLEHIPVDNLGDFVSALSRYLKPEGRLLLTVPHKRQCLQPKHCQHFSTDSVREILEPHFNIKEVAYLDKKSRVFERLMNRILRNRLFILNNQTLLRHLFNFYRKHLLYCDESHCRRLFVEGQKK